MTAKTLYKGHRKAQPLYNRGVMCIEASWEESLRSRGSVRPMLEMLESVGAVSYIYRDINSAGELHLLLEKWLQTQYKHWSILYLAAHGHNRGIYVDDDVKVDLIEIGKTLEKKCSGKVIHFGACSVARNTDLLHEFVKMTSADFVVGYQVDVDWVIGASFEMMLFDALARYKSPRAAFNYLMQKEAESMAEKLKFTVVNKNGLVY